MCLYILYSYAGSCLKLVMRDVALFPRSVGNNFRLMDGIGPYSAYWGCKVSYGTRRANCKSPLNWLYSSSSLSVDMRPAVGWQTLVLSGLLRPE